MLDLYVKYLYITELYTSVYIQIHTIHTNIFKMFTYICVYLYIHNKYTQYTTNRFAALLHCVQASL